MSVLAQQLLICLAAAHVIGDFWLQSDRDVRDKRKLPVLLRHALIVALLSYVLCGAWKAWFIPLGVFLAHSGIDAVKVRMPKQDATAFVVDQLAHGASITLVAFLVAREAPSLWAVNLFGEDYLRLMILLVGGLLTIIAGGVLVGLITDPLRVEMTPSPPDGSDARSQSRGLTQGGRMIGRLERSLILLFVLSGQAAGIGFLIAAKSIFRFGELSDSQNRMEAEYIIIGTMSSFGWGLLTANLTRHLLGLTWA